MGKEQKLLKKRVAPLFIQKKTKEIYITQAKELVNLVSDYGKTNLNQAKRYYKILEKLANEKKIKEIYIVQAKALVNLVYYYGETDLNQAECYYKILEKLANDKETKEIYTLQTEALSNLVVYCKRYYEILGKLANEKEVEGIYIEQAKALVNLVLYYGEIDFNQSKRYYKILVSLADEQNTGEIDLMQLQILGYLMQEKRCSKPVLSAMLEQYLQRFMSEKIQISNELLEALIQFTKVLIEQYSTDKPDMDDFMQITKNTNNNEKILYCLNQIHTINQQLTTKP